MVLAEGAPGVPSPDVIDLDAGTDNNLVLRLAFCRLTLYLICDRRWRLGEVGAGGRSQRWRRVNCTGFAGQMAVW